jgi:hypothetical protein
VKAVKGARTLAQNVGSAVEVVSGVNRPGESGDSGHPGAVQVVF